MSPDRKADVIVAADHEGAPVLRCLEAVLERSGPILNRLIVVDDQGPGSEIARELERFAGRDRRVVILSNTHPLGPVGSCNRGLDQRAGDAVLLAADGVVADDWLVELAAVAHSEERTACAAPLTNFGGYCSVTEWDRCRESDSLDEKDVRAACAGLPPWSVAPALSACCIYLRGDVIDAVGLLDESLVGLSDAVDDWVSRALAFGFMAKRANHVYVRGTRPAPVPTAADPDRDAPPGDDTAWLFEPFRQTLEGNLVAHAVEMGATGRIRVAYDIRHLSNELVGTRTYAVCLAQALAPPEVALTLLVHEPAQAAGLSGRVVTEADWCDDVALIHRPAQAFNPRELRLLLGSSAHLVITYQDLIAYRIPQASPTDAEFDGYRATTSFALPAVQKIIAYSRNAAEEITAEFGIPREEIAVVPLGVDASWFARRDETDAAIRDELGLPPRYFFSLATDYPHKNLRSLLDAYASLRGRWRGDEPPGLVLAGHSIAARAGLYSGMGSEPMGEGLKFLGPVTADQLRVLYQGALALVFPSLYEGFGLPPLEAMAAGSPVIAMPISSIPEVVGDCAVYPHGFSSEDLARAMLSVASDAGLRDELRDRGLRRAEQFRWEKTAQATLDAYRSAIRDPSGRSLRMRRHLANTFMCWGDSIFRAATPVPEPQEPSLVPESIGILNACRALSLAVSTRLRRELDRLHPPAGRRSA